jgi:hypothetical protein
MGALRFHCIPIHAGVPRVLPLHAGIPRVVIYHSGQGPISQHLSLLYVITKVILGLSHGGCFVNASRLQGCEGELLSDYYQKKKKRFEPGPRLKPLLIPLKIPQANTRERGRCF